MTAFNQEKQVVLGPQQNAGGNIYNTFFHAFIPRHASNQLKQSREAVLGRLRHNYSKMMSQSLQGIAWVKLGLSEKSDAVQTPAGMLLRISNSAGKRLPLSTPIIEVYDKVEHSLLILGEPGAGKSTLLLDLAQHLIKRAEQDETHPLPVLLSLSSWAFTRQQPLHEWAIEQLATIYAVPQKYSKQWMGENGILLLLDGLDEMEGNTLSACIDAINVYHSQHLAPLVVCSRTDEYEATVALKKRRLALLGAVSIQSLTQEQVDNYLLQVGPSLAVLRSTLQKNSALRDLATTPLMLNILALTYQDMPMSSLPNKKFPLLRRVWDDYVQRMIERKGNSEQYHFAQTIHWLSWMAREMREHNQTEFWLEHLQPEWLPKLPRCFYRCSIGLFSGAVVGLSMGRIFDALFMLLYKTNGIPIGFTISLFIAFGLQSGLGRIQPVEEHIWSWKKAFAEAQKGLPDGLFLGLLLLISIQRPVEAFIGTLLFIPLCGLIKGLIHGRSFRQKAPKDRLNLQPNQGIRHSIRNGCIYGIATSACCLLLVGLAFWFIGEGVFKEILFPLAGGSFSILVSLLLILGLVMGLLAGMAGGLVAVFQHYLLRLILKLRGLFPMQAVPFLEYAQARILLRRVGRGGYKFAHRLLLDYFADLSIESESTSASARDNLSSTTGSSV